MNHTRDLIQYEFNIQPLFNLTGKGVFSKIAAELKPASEENLRGEKVLPVRLNIL